MIDSDSTVIFIWSTHSRYGTEQFKLKYNWKFSSHGGYTAKEGMRLTDWQVSLAVL